MNYIYKEEVYIIHDSQMAVWTGKPRCLNSHQVMKYLPVPSASRVIVSFTLSVGIQMVTSDVPLHWISTWILSAPRAETLRSHTGDTMEWNGNEAVVTIVIL